MTNGNIISLDGRLPLSALNRTITNNISGGLVLPQVASATLLLNLQADLLGLSDSDPVSLWVDQSGNGHDFTQTGDARPTKQTYISYPAVLFDGVDDWMSGANFADNLPSMAIFFIYDSSNLSDTGYKPLISKISSLFTGNGWALYYAGYSFFLQQDDGSTYYETDDNGLVTQGYIVRTLEQISFSQQNIYVNNVLREISVIDAGPITNITNTDPVRLAATGTPSDGFLGMRLRSMLVYQITDLANWPTDRAAITAWLAARYGITL